MREPQDPDLVTDDLVDDQVRDLSARSNGRNDLIPFASGQGKLCDECANVAQVGDVSIGLLKAEALRTFLVERAQLMIRTRSERVPQAAARRAAYC